MTVEITKTEDARLLHVGKMPARMQMQGGGTISYYILTCDHGTTQLHDPHDYSHSEEVIASLVKEHHARLEGCECQPA